MAEQKGGTNAYFKLLLSYIIFGSIGIFVRFIPLPSSVVASFRGIVGALIILIFLLLTKRRPSKEGIRKNIVPLLISGTAIGFNWILLFEAYRYTSVATATLCYYTAPIFVTVASAFILHERFSPKRAVCVVICIVGMCFESGIIGNEVSGVLGIVLGVSAAVLYATGIICNKFMREIEGTDRAFVQLLTAGLVVLPYMLLTENIAEFTLNIRGAILLIIVGIVHTGFAYVINLDSIGKTPAQMVAVLSYTDPIVAIVLSAVILGEPLNLNTIIGAVLILGSTLVASIQSKKEVV